MVVATEGKPHQRTKGSSQRKRLARENRSLSLQVENARLKTAVAEAAVAEASVSLMQDNFVNRLDYLPSGFGFDIRSRYGINTYSSITDRQDGRNRPFIEDQVDAAYARGLARWITGSSGPGAGVGENLRNYVIGTGFKLSAAERIRRPAPEGLVEEVQEFVTELLTMNKWQCDGDREFYWRAERDGEVFLALYYRADGYTDFRFLEPEQIEEPAGRPWEDAALADRFQFEIKWATTWTGGIHTYEHDTNHVLGYCVRWAQGEELDYLPASQVVHVKFNVDRNIKRGLTSFYPVWKWLQKQESLLSKTADGAERIAGIAYIVQYALSTLDQVKAMRTAQADTKRKSPTVTGGTTEEYSRRGVTSDVVDLPIGQEYKEGPHGAERGHAFLEIIQGLLRQVGIRFCMPEYMVSGDASNGNYSSSIEAGGPFNKYCEAKQGTVKTHFETVIWLCLYHAFLRQRFKKYGLTWREFRGCMDVTLVPQDVAPNKGTDETDRRDKMHAAGVISTETYQELEGLDPDKEKARGAVGQRQDGMAPGGPQAGTAATEPVDMEKITSLVAKAHSGEIPPATLGPILQVACPFLTQDQVQSIIAPFAALAKAPLAGLAADGHLKINRQQWKRVQAAVADLARGLQAGTTTEIVATTMLEQLGLSPDQASRIVADAKDGTISDVDVVESVSELMWINRVWEGYP
jgi:hypothetical protein